VTEDRTRAQLQWVGGILLGVILAGAPAALFVLPQLAAVAAELSSIEDRVTGLEEFARSPISPVAIARFVDVEDRIEQLRVDVQRILKGQDEIRQILMTQQNRGAR
jgi:hypothetical protein